MIGLTHTLEPKSWKIRSRCKTRWFWCPFSDSACRDLPVDKFSGQLSGFKTISWGSKLSKSCCLFLSHHWVNRSVFPILSDLFEMLNLTKLRFFNGFPGPGGFKKLRETCRKNFHRSWYLLVSMVPSYDQKPEGEFLFSVYGIVSGYTPYGAAVY